MFIQFTFNYFSFKRYKDHVFKNNKNAAHLLNTDLTKINQCYPMSPYVLVFKLGLINDLYNNGHRIFFPSLQLFQISLSLQNTQSTSISVQEKYIPL